MQNLFSFALGMAAVAALGATLVKPAQADVTYVTDFSKNAVLYSQVGIPLPNGLFTTSNSFDTTFDIIPDSTGNNFADIGNLGSSDVLNIPVSIFGATDVFTLINGFNPFVGDPMTQVDFYGTGGTHEEFTLVNGVNVRDFNDYIYADTINGTTTQQAFTGPGPDGQKYVDEQSFALGSDFAGQTLTDITISNEDALTGSHTNSYPLLIGLTVNSTPAVPEPAPLGLLSLCLLPLGGLILRARRRQMA